MSAQDEAYPTINDEAVLEEFSEALDDMVKGLLENSSEVEPAKVAVVTLLRETADLVESGAFEEIPPPGVITAYEAALIKGMLYRADKQHAIAAFFGVNGGRIAEIATGMKFHEVKPAPAHVLPPIEAVYDETPYLKWRRSK